MQPSSRLRRFLMIYREVVSQNDKTVDRGGGF
jgi:hypothetical protein